MFSPEEGKYRFSLPLQGSHRRLNGNVKLFFRPQEHPANQSGLQHAPDEFNRIQLWRVGWKYLDIEQVRLGIHIGHNLFCIVRPVTIGNNDDRPVVRTNDLLQEFDEYIGIKTLHRHVAHVPFTTDGCNQILPKPGTCRFNNRRHATGMPGCSTMVVRATACLV